MRVGGQFRGQARNGTSGHQAVGVQHQHRLIGGTPSGDPFHQIADFLVGVLRTAAIMQVHATGRRVAQRFKGLPFLIGDGIVPRVAQHKEGIVVPALLSGQIVQHRRRIAKDIPWHFVIDRDQ